MWSLSIHPNCYKTKIYFFLTKYKNEWKERKCWKQKNKKSNFYKNKKVTKIDDIDVNKILVSKEEPYGTKNSFKYFIGYNDNVVRPLCVRLPQMTGYARKFDENATMSFRANNKQLLKNYNKIWEKVEKLLKIDFESKPVYDDNDKYIKTKIKIYGGGVKTNFQGKKNAKRKSTMQIFINNARFCCQSKEKVLSSNTIGIMQIWTKKDKNGEPY